MKMAIYGLSSVFGGVERFVLNTYNQLSDESITFTFLVPEKKPDYLQLKNNDSCICYTSRKKNFFKYLTELNDIFKNNDFDILWFNCCTLSSIDEIKFAYKYKIKRIILHSHNGENMGGKLTYLLHNYNKKKISKYVTDYFACSDIAAKWMFPENKISKVKYINNAIDAKLYTYNKEKYCSIKEKFGWKNHTVIGHVGRFHPQKNHKFIIDIFQSYLLLDKKTILVFCGDGVEKDEIEKYVIDKGISNKVVFMGNVKNIHEMYQTFDLFLFPSLYEGLPFALIEAQAAGIPCLISDRISKQIQITDLVEYQKIDETPERWASTLLSIKKEKINTYDQICKAGYDTDTNKQRIMEMIGMEF